jgi:hypothetical protein
MPAIHCMTEMGQQTKGENTVIRIKNEGSPGATLQHQQRGVRWEVAASRSSRRRLHVLPANCGPRCRMWCCSAQLGWAVTSARLCYQLQ